MEAEPAGSRKPRSTRSEEVREMGLDEMLKQQIRERARAQAEARC